MSTICPQKIICRQKKLEQEIKIVNAYAEIEVALPELNLVFLKNNGVFEGTDSVKYPFKVIHYEFLVDFMILEIHTQQD